MIPLFILLFLGLILWYYILKGELLSVTIISHLMYLFSSGILIMFAKFVNYEISLVTISVILGTLFFMGIGEYSARIYMKTPSEKIGFRNVHYYIKPKIYLFSNVIIVIVIFLSYLRFNMIGSSLGGGSFIENYALVRGAEVMATQGEEAISINFPYQRLLTYCTFISEGVLYFYIFLFINGIFSKQKNMGMYLLPILLSIPILVLSTERSIFIKMLSIVFILFFIMFRQKTCWRMGLYNNRKILKIGFITVLSFFILFGLLGLLKGQNLLEAPAEILCSYAGASIIGLDQYLNNNIIPKSEYFGQVSFYGIYQILNKLGFDFSPPPYHQNFFYWNFGNGASNIYCAPYYQMRDFPFLFVLFIYLFIGIIYGKGLNKVARIRNFKSYSTRVIMLSYYFYPIVMISITDAFRHLLSMKTIYIMLVLFLLDSYGTKKIILAK